MLLVKLGGLKTHLLGLIPKVNKIAYESLPAVPGMYKDYYYYCGLKMGWNKRQIIKTLIYAADFGL